MSEEIDRIDIDEELELLQKEPPNDLYLFRRYLLEVQKRERKLEITKSLFNRISEDYIGDINHQESRLKKYKILLQDSLLACPEFKTKSGGYSLSIPDIGRFSASKKNVKFTLDEKVMSDEEFQIEKKSFSKTKFNEWVERQIVDGYVVVDVENGTLINKITGEIYEGITPFETRTFYYPKERDADDRDSADVHTFF